MAQSRREWLTENSQLSPDELIQARDAHWASWVEYIAEVLEQSSRSDVATELADLAENMKTGSVENVPVAEEDEAPESD